MPLNKSELKNNLLYAFLAQMLSMLVSVVLALVVSKVLGVEAFSYWQLFIFYTLYGGVLPLGLTDGMYLRLGGKNYEEISHEGLRTQYHYSIAFQLFVCFCACMISSHFIGSQRLWVLVASCVCSLIINISNYYSFIFQAVNRVKYSSMSTILSRGLFVMFLGWFVSTRKQDYHILIIAYTLTCFASVILFVTKSKELLLGFSLPFRAIWADMKENIKVGLSLTVSSVASMSILGIGRFFIDIHFGIVEFGKVSFAILMMNFFIVFLNQVSIVLFPALRRINENEVSDYYERINRLFSLLSPTVLLLYPIIYLIIHFWLPKYEISLSYLLILLPLVCFEGKMQMVNNTFLKVSRNEKQMLKFNVVACTISAGFCFITVFLFHNITLTVFALMLSISLRSLWAEGYLSKQYNVKVAKGAATQIVMIILFYMNYYYFNALEASILFTILFLLLCVARKRLWKAMLIMVRKK